MGGGAGGGGGGGGHGLRLSTRTLPRTVLLPYTQFKIDMYRVRLTVHGRLQYFMHMLFVHVHVHVHAHMC